jgi:hypothetical protein
VAAAPDHERGVVAAVGFTDHADAGRHRRERPRPTHPQVPDLCHIQPSPVQGEAVAGQPDRLAAMFGPEPGVPDSPSVALARLRVEPVAVGAAGVLAGLYQHHGCDLGQPRPLWGLLGQGDDPALDLSVAELLAGLVGAFSLIQRVVVDHPGAPERPSQRLPLAGGRVEAVAVPDEHAADDTWPVRHGDYSPSRQHRRCAQRAVVS